MIFFLSQMSHGSAHEAPAAAHEAGAHSGPPHVANWVQLLADAMGPSPAADFLRGSEKIIYSLIVVGILVAFSIFISKNTKLIPSRAQLMMENVVSSLDGLVTGVLGPQGRAYTPFIGSLFIYIFTCNMFGLIPLQNAPMAFITTTAPLAISVFLYVQWIGITKNGPVGYIYHLAGSPKDIFGWILVPLNLPLHVLSEFVKPLSLSFRLYGNVMAGHILLGVFIAMGIAMLAPLKIPIGVPLHIPFLFLELLVGLIQAFVFTLLSTVYVAMMLPHEEHAHEPAH